MPALPASLRQRLLAGSALVPIFVLGVWFANRQSFRLDPADHNWRWAGGIDYWSIAMSLGMVVGPLLALVGLLMGRRHPGQIVRVAGGVLAGAGLAGHPLFWPAIVLVFPVIRIDARRPGPRRDSVAAE